MMRGGSKILESSDLAEDLCLPFRRCCFCCLWAAVFNCTVPLTEASTSQHVGVYVKTSPRRELVLTEQANVSVEKSFALCQFDETEILCLLKFS